MKTFQHGRRLLPAILDDLAITDPDHICGMMAKSADISEGFDELTMHKLFKAVNYMAHFLDNLLGKQPPGTFTPIAFIGDQDFRYWVMEFAAMKTSHQILIPGTRNALANTVSLMEVTGTKTLFWSGDMKDQAQAIQTRIPGLTIQEIPSLEEMYSTPSAEYPYTKTFDEAKNDPIIIAHTSGSTGAPKPITYTHDWIARCDADTLTPPLEGRIPANPTLIRFKTKIFSGTPFFHLSGIAMGVGTLFSQWMVVMGPSHLPPSGRIVCEIAKHITLQGMILVPSLCDDVFGQHGEEIQPYLGELEHVNWLGGPLAQSTGEWITTHTKAVLWQIYGSTEVCWMPLLVPDRSHWQYVEFHPIIGPKMERLHPESDLYEAVLHRLPDPNLAWARPIFKIFPDHKEWRMGDLFERCPDEGFENLWMFQGRVDDMMVMHNGLKVNPLHVENKLRMHPALKGCVVIGNGYTHCGLLLEPNNHELSKEDLVDLVWPKVEEANGAVPQHAWIQKHLIVVATSEKPLPRAAKGTIIRKLSIKSYEKEIADTYGGPPSGVNEYV